MSIRRKTVSTKGVFWAIMLDWRRWFIFGLIGAFIFGFFRYREDSKEYDTYMAAITKQENVVLNADDIELTTDELTTVQQACKYYEMVRASNEYCNNSVLMQLDPYHKKQIVIAYYVNCRYVDEATGEVDHEYIAPIIEMYLDQVTSGALSGEIAADADLNLDSIYAAELVQGDASDWTFEITLTHSDQDTLERMADITEQYILTYESNVASMIIPHTLVQTLRTGSTVTDVELADRQKANLDTLTVYRDTLYNLTASMSDEQVVEYQSLVTNRVSQGEEMSADAAEPIVVDSVITPVSAPRVNIRYCLIGFAAGMLLAWLWTMLNTIFSVRLKSASEMNGTYSVRLLGRANFEADEKWGIDALILKWKNRNKKRLSSDENMVLTCANIEIACEKEDVKSVYITGTEVDDECLDYINQLAFVLREAGIDVKYGVNVSYSADSMRQMVEIGHVIIVERVGTSLYREIENILRYAKENEVDILGCVVG